MTTHLRIRTGWTAIVCVSCTSVYWIESIKKYSGVEPESSEWSVCVCVRGHGICAWGSPGTGAQFHSDGPR